MKSLLSSALFLGFAFFQTVHAETAVQKKVKLNCPDGGVMIDFTAEFSRERMVFCQRSHNGKIVKHGPSLTYHENGKLKEKAYFHYGAPGVAPDKSAIDASADDINGRIEKVLNQVIANLLSVSPDRQIIIIKDPSLCFNSPEKRLQFIMDGTPYDNPITFASQCFFQGTFRYELGKDLKADFIVRDVEDFRKMHIEYTIHRLKNLDQVTMQVDITKGQLTGPKGNVNFKVYSTVEIAVQNLIMSQGRSGVQLRKLDVTVSEFEGKPVSYFKGL